MKYAVLKTGGKQYKVSVGTEIEVDKIEADVDSNISLDKVLLVADGEVFHVGQPHLEGVTITARVLEQKKGKKIRVAKFKAKARYRKVTGHRQVLTKVKIEKIGSSEEKKASKSSSAVK